MKRGCYYCGSQPTTVMDFKTKQKAHFCPYFRCVNRNVWYGPHDWGCEHPTGNILIWANIYTNSMSIALAWALAIGAGVLIAFYLWSLK